MSETIYKYPIGPVTDLQLPEGAEILCVQAQYGIPCIWVKVDTMKSYKSRQIRVYGTGYVLSDECQKYIGTFQLDGGHLVFHVFEVI